MTDPRVAKLAELLVTYSLELTPGQVVRLDGGTVAAPLVRELYREALRAGAYPRTRVEVEGIDVIAIGEASELAKSIRIELDESFLRGIAIVEALPENQSGADKTWIHRLVRQSDDHFAAAVRRR